MVPLNDALLSLIKGKRRFNKINHNTFTTNKIETLSFSCIRYHMNNTYYELWVLITLIIYYTI